MKPTHGYAANWSVFMTVPTDRQEAAQRLARSLSLLNGETKWSTSLWALPQDVPTRGLNRAGATEYLQSAGSAKAMTVEWRRLEADVDEPFALYAVGRNEETSGAFATISWSGHSMQVPSSEAFTAEQALPLYLHYLEHGEVPPEMHLQLLERLPD